MLFACSGYDVKLYDVNQEQLQRALEDIKSQLSALYEEGLQRSTLTLTEVVGHISTATSLEDCVTGASYVQVNVVWFVCLILLLFPVSFASLDCRA